MTDLKQPLTFRHGATVRNRFVEAPMLTSSGNAGFATQDTIDYYRARSKAGGMIITGYTYVSENGGPSDTWRDDQTQLAIYDDKFIPQLAKVAQAIKQDGNKAILQIVHTGRWASFRAMQGKSVYGPSAIPTPSYPVLELTDTQIRKIISDFGAATKRAIAAGFDGVEIHGANHFLNQQFFSKYFNRRTDHWGGSLEKRMNFPLAVVKAVTDVVKQLAPKNFIVGYRISPEEIHRHNGYTWRESTQLIDQITQKFTLDYIHLSMARYDQRPANPQDADKTLAELFQPVLNGAKEITVGGVNSQATAEAASQLADLVAVATENLIDPLFADKVLRGADDQVVRQMTVSQLKAAHLTPGLIERYFRR